MGFVVGDQGAAQGQGLGRDQQVHRSNALSLRLQFMADPSIVLRTQHGIVIVDLERGQDLVDRRNFPLIVVAVRPPNSSSDTVTADSPTESPLA